MKKMMMVALVMLTSSSIFATTPHPVKVVSKAKDVVYFKVDNSMVDASMKIFNENGLLIHTGVIHSKKTIVDFYAEPSGSYTIELWKNGKKEVITYAKSSASAADHNEIVVAEL